MNTTSASARHIPAPALPGDLSGAALVERVLRVDHAGEYGAKQIYAGQLWALRKRRHSDAYKEIEHMAEQEQAHLDTFNALLPERRVRPSALQPFWHVAGFALGAGTALLGEKAAMACTVAVETEISDHYARQAKRLGESEPELKATLEKFRDEELEHHDTGLAHGAEDTPGYAILNGAIRKGTRLAIWLAERV